MAQKFTNLYGGTYDTYHYLSDRGFHKESHEKSEGRYMDRSSSEVIGEDDGRDVMEVEVMVQVALQHQAPQNENEVEAFLLPNNKKANYLANPNPFRKFPKVK